MTRVSVIIPSYNREALLCETLDSLRAQTFSDWEAIIVDDNSKDGSLEVARRYSALDGRFRAFSRQGEKLGACVCRNQGLSFATGDLIVFLDSDDLLSESCLEHRVIAMDRFPDCGYGVYLSEIFKHTIGDQKQLWNSFTETGDLLRFLSLDLVWFTTCPIWRKPVILQLGGFDETLPSFQDWALHVRALIAGIKYFKEPIRDNFHRYDYGLKNTISSVASADPDHLRSHEKLFFKTISDLRVAGLLDERARIQLAKTFWWLARRWQLIANDPEAHRIWRQAHRLGYFSWLRYLKGIFAFRVYSMRGGAHIAFLIRRLVPKAYYKTFSE